jgi:uncharacterized protein YbjT (DUF2867 family)
VEAPPCTAVTGSPGHRVTAAVRRPDSLHTPTQRWARTGQLGIAIGDVRDPVAVPAAPIGQDAALSTSAPTGYISS